MSKIDLEAFKGFTPGPWRLEKETTLIWGACNPHIEGSYGMGYPVALAERKRSWSRTSEPTDCEIEANAILIAAAPDLLALAKEQSEEIKRLRAEVAEARAAVAAYRIEALEAENKALREGADSAWRKFPAPPFADTRVAGVQPRSGSSAAYWWVDDDVTDENGAPRTHTYAIRWHPNPKPPTEDCEAAARALLAKEPQT